MFLKIAHHGARVLTLVTGFGLMTVLLIPGLTGDSSVTLTSMHVRAAAIAAQSSVSGAFLNYKLPFPPHHTRAAFPHGLCLCRAVVAGRDDVRH